MQVIMMFRDSNRDLVAKHCYSAWELDNFLRTNIYKGNEYFCATITSNGQETVIFKHDCPKDTDFLVYVVSLAWQIEQSEQPPPAPNQQYQNPSID